MSEQRVWYTFTQDKKIQQFVEKERLAESDPNTEEIVEFLVSTDGEQFEIEQCFATVGDLLYSWTGHLSNSINSMKLNLFYLEELKKTVEFEVQAFLRDHIEVR